MGAQERFMQYVKPMASGCHEWQSTLHRTGYGVSQITVSRILRGQRLFLTNPAQKGN